MSLEECQRKHTYRQFKTWLAWLDEQWNIPDRHDWYMMALMAETWRCQLKPKDRSKVKAGDFKLKFDVGESKKAPGPKDRKEAAQWAKAKWLPWVGIKEW